MHSSCFTPNRAVAQRNATNINKGKSTQVLAHVSKVSKSVTRDRRSLVVRSAATEEVGLAETKNDGGFIEYFPTMYNLESLIAETSTGGFSKKMMIYSPGGVADQLILFPFIKWLKTSLPQASIDVVCGNRAHSAYDICPYITNTHVYDVDGQPLSNDYAELLGTMKGEYYDKIIAAKPVGLNGASFLWMASPGVIGYTSSNGLPTNFFAEKMLESSVQAPAEDPLTLGTSAYDSLKDLVGEVIAEDAAEADSADVKVGVPEGAQKWAVNVLAASNVTPEKYILAHGVPSTSQAAMTMTRFPESSSASIEVFTSIAQAAALPVVFAVPREADSAAVLAAVPNATVVVVPNPSKLAALVALSSGVVAANTAALPLSSYMGKPAVGVFDSTETAAKFQYEGVNCVCADDVSSAVSSMMVAETVSA